MLSFYEKIFFTGKVFCQILFVCTSKVFQKLCIYMNSRYDTARFTATDTQTRSEIGYGS